MMSCTQGNTITKNVNKTYNVNDRNKAKHIETDKVNDQVYIGQANHKHKLSLIKLILQWQVHIDMDSGNEIKSEVQGDRD